MWIPFRQTLLAIGEKLLCSHVLLEKLLDLASCDLFFCISHRTVLKLVCKVLGTEQDDAPVKRRLVHFDCQTLSSSTPQRIPLVHKRVGRDLRDQVKSPSHCRIHWTIPDRWLKVPPGQGSSRWASLSCLNQFHKEKLTHRQQAHQVLTCLLLQVDKQEPTPKGLGNLCCCIDLTPHRSQKATQRKA